MNYTQNEKIEQVTDSTMVVGVDIGSQIHYARAFDNRGRELTKRIFSFHNDLEGFNSFNLWAETLKTENKKTAVLIGCEPTGHYWFAFAKYVNDHQKRLVMVNPFSVNGIASAIPRKRVHVPCRLLKLRQVLVMVVNQDILIVDMVAG